jgi:hypothetical protein
MVIKAVKIEVNQERPNEWVVRVKGKKVAVANTSFMATQYVVAIMGTMNALQIFFELWEEGKLK